VVVVEMPRIDVRRKFWEGRRGSSSSNMGEQ
jgi:hypothetical protein